MLVEEHFELTLNGFGAQSLNDCLTFVDDRLRPSNSATLVSRIQRMPCVSKLQKAFSVVSSCSRSKSRYERE